MKRTLARIATLVLALATLVALVTAAVLLAPGPRTNGAQAIEVLIPAGASADSVARLLAEKGVVRSPFLFLLTAKVLGKENDLKAGYYAFASGANCYRVVSTLASGKGKLIRVTVPEGLRSWEIASLFQRKLGIDSSRFVALVHDSSFVAELGCDGPSLEGYLFPETYYFAWGTPAEEVIRAMVQNCLAVLDSSVRARADSLGLSLHQVLTIASLIEGETKVDSERVLVSAVYHNRLRRGMKLEADPTIQYLIGGRRRRLYERDLRIDSPYNTYLHPGLPPGPVNNPGRKSIWAAVHPARVGYLFFVADGNGGHYFSRTLAEHLRYKAKLDRLRRQLRLRKGTGNQSN